MTYSKYITGSITTPNQSTRGGRKIDHIVLHHMASTNYEWVKDAMRTGSKEVSANYIVSNEGAADGVVPEELRSWSLSSAEWDGRSITFEIENESLGGNWPVSNAAQEKVAQIVADICVRYGIPCNRDRILGHREVYSRHGASYPTACPGGLNMDWIVARANQIIQGSTPAPTPEESITNMAQRAYYARVDAAGNDNGEWMLAGVDIGPLNENGTVEEKKQDGYRITTDKETAKVWARQYSVNPEKTAATHLTRDLYIKQQEFARKDAREWRAFIRSLFTGK